MEELVDISIPSYETTAVGRLQGLISELKLSENYDGFRAYRKIMGLGYQQVLSAAAREFIPEGFGPLGLAARLDAYLEDGFDPDSTSSPLWQRVCYQYSLAQSGTRK